MKFSCFLLDFEIDWKAVVAISAGLSITKIAVAFIEKLYT